MRRGGTLFWLYLWIAIFGMVRSSFFLAVFPMTVGVQRLLTVLYYSPFFVIGTFKFYVDKEGWRTGKKLSKTSRIYYLFIIYYLILSLFRFFLRYEIKENVYFTVILVGSIALFILIRDNKVLRTCDAYFKFVECISSFFLLYRVVDAAWLAKYFERPLINVNLTSGIVAMLLPLHYEFLFEQRIKNKQRCFSFLLIIFTLAIISSTGSRSIFWLTLGILMAESICALSKIHARLFPMVGTVFVSIVLIAALVYCDVGNIQYSLMRETNGILHLDIDEDDYAAWREEIDGPVIEGASDDLVLQAKMQISRSDSMRSTLMQWGIDQIKMNPWFGTGNVCFSYEMPGSRTYQQSSHNFIIESMICYGVFGSIILVILYLAIFRQSGMFSFKSKRDPLQLVTCWAVVIFYFAFGFVEPIVFDALACPLFAIIMGAHSSKFACLK